MNIFSLCGIALITFSGIQIVGKDNRSFGTFIGICGILSMILPALLSLHPLFETIKKIFSSHHLENADLIFRALGIGLCSEFTGEICREAGESGISHALDFSTKILILSMAFPLIKDLFELLGGLAF